MVMTFTDAVRELIDEVKADLAGRFSKFQHERYLKKRGWTEEEFQRIEDPDRNVRCSRVKDYYGGYQHIHSFTTTRTLPWTEFANWMDCYEQMNEWCKANCQGKFRSDILRVIKAPSTNNEWELNDIGGGDALFYAFKDSRDFTMFCLRWG
jgi:hypothetical protein